MAKTIVKGIRGARAVSFESRQADKMLDMLSSSGAEAVSAPALQEIPLEKNQHLFDFAGKLLAGEIDVLLLLTGGGTRLLMDVLLSRHSEDEVRAALGKTTVVTRGSKPVEVLSQFQIPVAVTVPWPSTWHEILETLDLDEMALPLKGAQVAVQEYGMPNDALVHGLEQRGAVVHRVPMYRWSMPEDREPLIHAARSIIDGQIQIAFFTNAMQIRNFFAMASEIDLADRLRQAMSEITVASIGPSTTEAIHELGLSVQVEASQPEMQQLIQEVVHYLESPSREPSISVVSSEERPRRSQIVDSPFIRACRSQETPYTPIWLMRQAGRYMKEYREIRNKMSFLELCKNRDLVAEITVMAVEKLKVDAAILFSDILVIVEPLGLGLHYAAGEGPVIHSQVRESKDVDSLNEVEPLHSLSYVLDAMRLTRSCLRPEIPLIGFAGAPFTLASYMIEGGATKNFIHTKRFMFADSGAWHELMAKIARNLVKFLNAQIDAGADAVQIFDSWVGALSPEAYREYVLPHSQFVIEKIRPRVPVIHFGTGTSAFLTDLAGAGGDVIGVDFRVDLDRAWQVIGHDRAIQGNLDPVMLFAPISEIRKNVKRILEQAGGRPGHIFNLGHGVLPDTPVEHVQALVEIVHELSQNKSVRK